MPLSGRHSRRFRKDEPEPAAPRLGPRRAALKERKKSRRRKEGAGALAGALAIAVLAAALVWLASTDGDGRDRSAGDGRGGEAVDPVEATLLFGTHEGDSEVVWVTLLTYNEANEDASVIYVPAHTAVEIPGRGLHGLGEAFSTGGVPLLLISAENLLGMDVDRYVELSEGDARVLFDATGPISVDVPTEVRVRAGGERARVVFGVGRQRLPAEFLAQLLYTVGLEGDDVELGSRHLAFWQGLFEAFEEEPDALGRAIERAGPALESDAAPNDHARFFELLASLDPSRRALEILPVEQVSVGGNELYVAHEQEIGRFLEQTVGIRVASQDEIGVQILNGNGVPGIGQEVADRLVGEGFKIVVSTNARRFDYERTLIIAYEDSPDGEELAERARELLGVGEVQFSEQSQGIVDLTIVVGKDFLGTL